jgi:hypothetical protein
VSLSIMQAVCQLLACNTLLHAAQQMAEKFERRVRATVTPFEAENIDFGDRSFPAACVYMAARERKLSVSEQDVIAAAGCGAAKFKSACNLMREICVAKFRRVDRSERVAHRWRIPIVLSLRLHAPLPCL